MPAKDIINNLISCDEIRAKKIVIVDNEERPKILLTTAPDGYSSPFIVMLDNSGITRVQIVGKIDSGATLDLFDAKGKSRVEIKIMQGGPAGLAINYADGEKRHIDIFSDGENDAFIMVRDKENKRGQLLLFGDIKPA